MRLAILSVGSLQGRLMAPAVREYEERARRYFRLECIEVPAGSGHGGNADLARAQEADSILRRLPGDLEPWALTRVGRTLASHELAEALQDRATYGGPGIVFLLGGAFGLDDRIVERCQVQLSLSKLTLPHDMARLVLAEQLYRAGTILRGEPYHKGT